MTSRSSRVLAAVLAAAGIAVCTACSSSSSPTSHSTTGRSASAPASSTSASGAADGTIDAAFAARANHDCTVVNAYDKTHPFPFPNFDPRNPTVKDLPAIGAYFAKNPELTRQIIALGSPKTGAQAWKPVVSALRSYDANFQRQVSAAKASDTKAFLATVNAFPAINARLSAAAQGAGLNTSAPACATYYGG